jgi:hypothetical protein
MKPTRLSALLLLLLPVSTIVAACGGDEDTDARTALERESLQRDLDLALTPDSAADPDFSDVPDTALVTAPPPVAEARPEAPPRRAEPAPRRAAPAPRRAEPAPEPSRPAEPVVVTKSVPAGTSFAIRLNQEVSTRATEEGTTFTATLSEPLRADDGSVLIPAGATVRGRVTESEVSDNAGETARIAMAITSISSGGESYPVSGTVTDVPVRKVTRDSKTTQAAKVGGGAVAGAVLGRVIGKSTKSTVAGAAIGAAAGTAVAMGTGKLDAVVDAGSTVTVRLDGPVRVQTTS